jgi:hypothetical protein
MFFLLRMAFWLGLVLVLLPSGSTQPGPAISDVGASDALSAASATVTDMRGFCARQPDACTVGSHIAAVIGYRAQAGAKMLYEFLTEAMARREGASPTAGSERTAATSQSEAKSTTEKNAQGTLTSVDLAPAWRGPVAHRDGKSAI